MIATEPLPERLFDCPHYSRHGFDYWQQREDGRLLAGGFRDTALDDEFTTSEETTPAIQSSLESLVSDLVGWPVVTTHRWAGLFGFVPDFMPVVGRVPVIGRFALAGGQPYQADAPHTVRSMALLFKLPSGEEWRTGADEATTLKTDEFVHWFIWLSGH